MKETFLIPLNTDGGKLNKSRIFYIDIIRFIACFFVVFYHLTISIPILQQYFGNLGRVGVGLFFMISGASLINGYYGELKPKDFYFKRFKSIYPSFYIAYFIMFLFMYVRNGFHNFIAAPKWTFIFTVLGIDGYAPPLGKSSYYLLGEWFLPVIIFIYLIFPIWRKIFLKFPTATLIFFFILRIGLIVKNIFPVALCFNPIPAISYFTLGAYVMLLSCGKLSVKNRRIPLYISSVILLAIGIFISHRLNLVDLGEIFSTLGAYILIVLFSKYITDKYVCRFISFISSISYEIFLTHHIIIFAVGPLIAANFSWLSCFTGGIATAIFTLGSAYLVKKISGWFIKK